MGVTLWFLAYAYKSNGLAHSLGESATDIFGLVIFLLSAMTLVEILTHYGLFDYLYQKLLALHVHDRVQFWILTSLAFIFSSFLDNLTTTIVFIQIASRFFRKENLLRTGIAIVIAANAGGAFSPIGDVTTTMLWLAQKFDVLTVMTHVFLPSLTVFLVSNALIGQHIRQDTRDIRERSSPLRRSEIVIIMFCLASFVLPLFMNMMHLPPYVGLLLGLGIVWFAVDIFRIRNAKSTKLALSIEKLFQKTDIASIYFFIGILLAIGALRHLGVLDQLSLMIFGSTSTGPRVFLGSTILGIVSAVFDNIPLTAAAIEIVHTTSSELWTLLAFTVGVGGSLLVIGSAPGIIAMTLLKNLTFGVYMRIATVPVLLAYAAGIGVWVTQFYLSGGSL